MKLTAIFLYLAMAGLHVLGHPQGETALEARDCLPLGSMLTPNLPLYKL
jgi:hypothetical protein